MATSEERRARLLKLVNEKHAKEAKKLQHEKETKVRHLPRTSFSFVDFIKRRNWVVDEDYEHKQVQKGKRKLEIEDEVERPTKKTKTSPSSGDKYTREKQLQKKVPGEQSKVGTKGNPTSAKKTKGAPSSGDKFIEEKRAQKKGPEEPAKVNGQTNLKKRKAEEEVTRGKQTKKPKVSTYPG